MRSTFLLHSCCSGIGVLSENRKDVGGGEVSVQECERAINNIKSNESPDKDGLPIEFYRSGVEICENNTLTMGLVDDEKYLVTVQAIFYSSNYRPLTVFFFHVLFRMTNTLIIGNDKGYVRHPPHKYSSPTTH